MQQGIIDSDNGYYLSFFCMIFSIAIGWTISRVAPKLSSPLVVASLGMFYAMFIAHQGEVERMNTSALDGFIVPLAVFSGLMELDVHLATLVEAQFMIISILGCILMTVANSFVMWGLSTEELGGPALISIGGLFTAFNFGPIAGQLSEAGASERFMMLLKGESIFGSLLPVFFLNFGMDYIARNGSSAVFTDSWINFLRSDINPLCIGVSVGMLFLSLIEQSSDKYKPSDRIFQIVLTLMCPFVALNISAATLHAGNPTLCISAAISAGWVIAWKVWPSIIAKDQVRSTWSVVGFLAESTSFYLGVLLGYLFRSSYEHGMTDGDSSLTLVGPVFLAFIAFGVIRVVSFIILSPLVNLVGQSVTMNEMVMWAWAGTIKGKIQTVLTLTTAIKFLGSKGDASHLQVEYYRMLLIYGSGITFLSLLISAPLTSTVASFFPLGRPSFVEVVKSGISRLTLQRSVNMAYKEGRDNTNSGVTETCPSTLAAIQAIADDAKLKTLTEDDVKEALRDIFYNVLVKLYNAAAEGKNYVIVRLISNVLLESVQNARDFTATGLTDWKLISLSLPPRESEIVFVIHLMVSCHTQAQSVMEEKILTLQGNTDVFTGVLTKAWRSVKSESNRICGSAGTILVRVSPDEVEQSHKRLDAVAFCEGVEDHVGQLAKFGVFGGSGSIISSIAKDLTALDRVQEGQSRRLDAEDLEFEPGETERLLPENIEKRVRDVSGEIGQMVGRQVSLLRRMTGVEEPSSSDAQ